MEHSPLNHDYDFGSVDAAAALAANFVAFLTPFMLLLGLLASPAFLGLFDSSQPFIGFRDPMDFPSGLKISTFGTIGAPP